MRMRLLTLLVFAFSDGACAEKFAFANVHTVSIDWLEVGVALADASVGAAPSAPVARKKVSSALNRSQRRTLASINRAIGGLYAWVPASTVPVLLPFDLSAYLRDSSSKEGAKSAESYHLGAVTKVEAIDAGPAGYDVRLLKMLDGEERTVTVSSSALLYSVPAAQAATRDLVLNDAQVELRVRDYIIEGERRLAFERFGMTYVLSAYCSQEQQSTNNCEGEGTLLVDVAKALRFVGGGSSKTGLRPRPRRVPRPPRRSPIGFTYHAPGSLLAGSGQGSADTRVYAWMRFPIESVPAYSNSQVFMDGGNCLDTNLNLNGDVPGQPFVLPRAAYDCVPIRQRLVNDEGSPSNYGYPWRDNFCEQRDWSMAVCPGGVGHRGQDIRPGGCTPMSWQADSTSPVARRCQPFLYSVVAVDGGTIARNEGGQALNLYVNGRSDRVKARYMHMDPKTMDADGMTNGRNVVRGEKLGLLGNYLDGPFGTSTHLHFELSVPTLYGWIHVNPYASLIVSYERLIGTRGSEVPGNYTVQQQK